MKEPAERVPVTCVFLAFAFPLQVFPLSAADERRHGRVAVLGFCKQTNIVLTNPGVCKGQIYTHRVKMPSQGQQRCRNETNTQSTTTTTTTTSCDEMRACNF